MKPTYKAPETTAGDLNTPVTFVGMTGGGYMPGDEVLGDLYFCMAEHYEASIKDYEIVNTTNARYVVTILIPHPREDYIPKNDHFFKLEDIMYDDVLFNIESIVPKDSGLLKMVGVAYDG